MQKVTQLPLAVTQGDPAGIGIEITCRAWALRHETDIPPFALIGDPAQIDARARALKLAITIAPITRLADAMPHFASALPVISEPQAVIARAGQPDPRNGPATIASIERAVAAVIAGEAAAVVTNPIAKNVLYASGFAHPGHTEFLAVLAARAFPGPPCTPVMMLAAAELRVIPLTVHVPLAAVPALVTQRLIIETTRIVHAALIRDYGLSTPRIAVAGLNPHAGEVGSIGTEDETVVRPAVAALRAAGLNVTGPHSADTLFHDAARATYDAAIAMYHDQALIPIKTLAFDRGVNVTLGLPFVRTSPDHGTAFDIAALGVARPQSFIEALRLARTMGGRRARTGGVT
jgi:4-hydroxythreonine-4-phosphate dehydrogenase